MSLSVISMPGMLMLPLSTWPWLAIIGHYWSLVHHQLTIKQPFIKHEPTINSPFTHGTNHCLTTQSSIAEVWSLWLCSSPWQFSFLFQGPTAADCTTLPKNKDIMNDMWNMMNHAMMNHVEFNNELNDEPWLQPLTMIICHYQHLRTSIN